MRRKVSESMARGTQHRFSTDARSGRAVESLWGAPPRVGPIEATSRTSERFRYRLSLPGCKGRSTGWRGSTDDSGRSANRCACKVWTSVSNYPQGSYESDDVFGETCHVSPRTT